MTDTYKLKRLADAATQGPWWIRPTSPSRLELEVMSNSGEIATLYASPHVKHEETAAFIVGASPKAILALIAENERLRDCVSGPAAWLERWASHVGGCRADDGMRPCTCGLDRARYDLARIDAKESK